MQNVLPSVASVHEAFFGFEAIARSAGFTPTHIDDVNLQQLEQESRDAELELQLADVEGELAEHAAYEALLNLHRKFGAKAMEATIQRVEEQLDAEWQRAHEARCKAESAAFLDKLYA